MTTATKNKLYRIGNSLLSALYPDRCAICGELVNGGECVCVSCDDSFVRKPDMFYIGKTVCYSVCEYTEVNKQIIFGAKNNRDFHKLCFMASGIYELLKAYGVIDDIDAVIPVPASLKRRITRGYNHTEKISRHLSFLSGIDVIKAVRKTKETGEQKTLSRSERLVNLKGCYCMSKRNIVRNKTVLLIDDVTTTGATLKEISELLQSEGNNVICAVFARTPYKDNKE